MKTTRLTTYGGDIRIEDVPDLHLRPIDVLVRVAATAVTAGDHRIWSGKFPPGFAVPARLGVGVFAPRMKTLGGVFSGQVQAVGEKVAAAPGLAVGEHVAGMVGSMGAHAEFVRVPDARVVAKPAGLEHTDAAALLFGGVTALYFLERRAQLQAGERVLVNGASGAVGSSAVQLAKHLGAAVTAVCSAANADLARRLGADVVIDYREHPVVGLEERFDVVFDTVGNISRREGLGLLCPGGRVILAAAGLADVVRARGPVIAGVAPDSPELVEEVLELGAAGVLDPLAEIVGGLDQVHGALERIGTRRKVGNLVVIPSDSEA